MVETILILSFLAVGIKFFCAQDEFFWDFVWLLIGTCHLVGNKETNKKMNAKLLDSVVTSEYQFEVEFNGIKYSVEIWLNLKGKFIDDLICFPNGDALAMEGEEREIRQSILDYLDENWENLIK